LMRMMQSNVAEKGNTNWKQNYESSKHSLEIMHII